MQQAATEVHVVPRQLTIHCVFAVTLLACSTDARAADEAPASSVVEAPAAATAAAKQLFARMAGHWRGQCRTWFEPGKLADESTTESDIELVFGELLLRRRYQGSMLHEPRRGEEWLAFNAITISLWKRCTRALPRAERRGGKLINEPTQNRSLLTPAVAQARTPKAHRLAVPAPAVRAVRSIALAYAPHRRPNLQTPRRIARRRLHR